MVGVLVAAIATVALAASRSGATAKPNRADQLMAARLGDRIADARVQLVGARRELAVARSQRVVAQRSPGAMDDFGLTTDTILATVMGENGPLADVLVTFTVSGANAGATGTCAPVDCRSDSNGQVTFTYVVRNLGDDTITIVCEPNIPRVTLVRNPPPPPPPPPPTTAPPGKPNIFQFEFRNCRNLHVGYNYFPEGVVVEWTAFRKGRTISTGNWVAQGGGKTYHFLTQPLGVRIPDEPDAGANFTWVINGVQSGYYAARAPGC